MKERSIGFESIVPSNDKPSVVSEPGEDTLHFPSFAVAAQRASVLQRRFDAALAMGTDDFDAALGQALAKRVAVVSFVHDQPLRLGARTPPSRPGHSHGFQRFFGQRDFARGCRVKSVSQRKTLAVCHHHPLCALPPLGFSHRRAPFFAGANEPSMNDSLQSNCPRSSSSPKNVRQMRSHVPSTSHSVRRRQHVEALGYCLGSAAHGAPVHRIHKMPSKTGRSATRGRPPFGLGLAFGNNCSIFCHCSSLNNLRDFEAIGFTSDSLLHKITHSYKSKI